MSHFYRLYGITFRCDWELPQCELTSGDPTVEIIRCSSDELREAGEEAAILPSLTDWYRVSNLHDGSTFMHFPSLFDFLISTDGRRVCVDRHGNSYDEIFQNYLLTHAMSYVMLELGIEQLHATCVAVDRSALAFVGESTHGKSTLAASFVNSGYRLITDDLLVPDPTTEDVHILPGLPYIKLFPEIARRLLGQHVQGEPMNLLTEKMIILLGPDQFHRERAPLKCLYVLAPPSARAQQHGVQITPLSKQEAFVELCKAEFNPDTSKRARLERQFAFAASLASKVPIKLLCFTDGIESLDAVRNAVLSDIG